VGSPVPSPDGKWIVTSVSEPAYDEKDEVADLWILPADGSAPPRRLTATKGTESGPAWSPDGRKLAFSAKREGDEAAQIYVLDLAGGEAQRITARTLGARAPKWSRDGHLLLFEGDALPGALDEAAQKQAAGERKALKSKVRTYDGFPIRRWDRWLEDKQTHLFVVPADGSKAPRDLLAATAMVKAKGFRGASGEGATDSLEPEWAPDSASIVFTATVDGDVAAYAEPAFQLYQVALDGSEPKALTRGNVNHSSPQFSPDGRVLAFQTSAGKEKLYALDRLAVAPWPWTGAERTLAPAFDRSIGAFTFAPDGRTLYFTGEDSGRVRMWSVPTAGGEPKLAVDTPNGAFRGVRIPAGATATVLFSAWESAVNPAEIVRIEPAARKPAFLTSFNAAKAASLDWQPLREFWTTTKTGKKIHSFLALPPAFDETKKYPLLVLMHGGHASMWTDAITKRWNYHLLAQPGYVVLLSDYRGSTGYGEAFTLDILGDPLRGPAEDINACADDAIQRFPFIDGSRQAAAGASYGGHLANWMEGTTTRYKCLISHAGLASLFTQWATSDGIYHREQMMGGPYWENPKPWLDQSPIMHAKSFRTPMLLSVGENDFRVPVNNALEMWATLQRMKVPSRFLVWPEAHHWILKGEDSRRFYEEVHAWLKRWL
jgi:dipeptidyl aminopeptidase/acylaminoacyl peptidase